MKYCCHLKTRETAFELHLSPPLHRRPDELDGEVNELQEGDERSAHHEADPATNFCYGRDGLTRCYKDTTG